MKFVTWAFYVSVVVVLALSAPLLVHGQFPPDPPVAAPVHMSVVWDESVTVPEALTAAVVPSSMPGIQYRLDRLRATLVKIDSACYLWLSETPSATATALQIVPTACP